MHTAMTTTRRRGIPFARLARLAAAGAAALAAAAAAIGFAVFGGGDHAAPDRAAPAVIDARPLVDPSDAGERFHHRLQLETARADPVDPRPAAELFHHRP
jgi:hypothetical protein